MTYQTIVPFTPALEKRFDLQLKKLYVSHSDMKKKRPELNNVNITENGSIQLTNSYVGVQLENTDATPTHLERYPDMSNLFEVDRSRVDDSVPLQWDDLKILENHLNVIYKQKVDNVKLTLSSEGIKIENSNLNHVFIKSEIATELLTDRDHTFNMNPRYLHDALMFFRQIYKDSYYIRVWTYQKGIIRFTYDNMTYLIATKRSY